METAIQVSNRKKTILSVAACVAVLLSSPISSFSASADDAPQQLLVRAKQALGFTTNKNLVSLVITGEFTSIGSGRTVLPATQTSRGQGGRLNAQMVPTDEVGNVRLAFILPGKFRQDYTYFTSNGEPALVRMICREGEELRSENRPAQQVSGTLSISVDPARPPDAAMRRGAKITNAIYLLALALYIDPEFPIQFGSLAKAEAPDGRADVLVGTGPEGLTVKLFLDEKTHRPLMISYAAATFEGIRQIRIGEHRETGGIFFPHLLSRSSNGNLTQQLRLEKFSLNGPQNIRDFCK